MALPRLYCDHFTQESFQPHSGQQFPAIGKLWTASPLLVSVFNKNYVYLRGTTWLFHVCIHSEMIATVRLINISSQSYCVYLMRAPETFFIKFPVFNTVSLTRGIMLLIRSLDLLTHYPSAHFPHLAAPGNHHSTICFYIFDFSKFQYKWDM